MVVRLRVCSQPAVRGDNIHLRLRLGFSCSIRPICCYIESITPDFDCSRLRWTPLSRPFLVGNKLILGGSEFEFGRPWRGSRPLSFRRSNRRSGRIPAEPYLPFEYL